MTEALMSLKTSVIVKAEREAFAARDLRILEMKYEDVRVGFHLQKMES
jgi:hypothetical protein